MENLFERVTCKKCSTTQVQEVEILNVEPIKVSSSSLNALVIKKVTCKECGSNEHHREFIREPEKDAI